MGIAGWVSQPVPTPFVYPRLAYFPRIPYTDNPPTLEGASLGRYLFYEACLSRDSSLSCGSCHRQETAFADGSIRFSTGSGGALQKRNTQPLFNLIWYERFFWDGRAQSLEEQVFEPVRAHNEMNLDWPTAVARLQQNPLYPPKFLAAFGSAEIDSMTVAKAIAQFERTLISHNAKFDRVIRGETHLSQEEYDGFVLINDQTKGNCLHCHTTDGDALGTTGKFSDNGLEAAFSPQAYLDKGLGKISGNVGDVGKFRIPSLRNIAITAPYMHDGRFETLEEVLDFYSEGVHDSYNRDPRMGAVHRGGVHLTEIEKRQVIAFLHTLTDSAFISNPDFSNPH